MNPERSVHDEIAFVRLSSRPGHDTHDHRAVDLPAYHHEERANLGFAQLDWIAGFEIDESFGLRLQLSITPCLRCIEQDKVIAVKRTIGSMTTTASLRSLRRLQPGTRYWLSSNLNSIGIVNQGHIVDDRCESDVKHATTFDDNSSFVCTISDLRLKRPELAAMIDSFAWCPASAAFFVSIAIPKLP